MRCGPARWPGWCRGWASTPPPAGSRPPAAVVAAVAARSGRPDAAVHATLFGPPPVDDPGLVALADTLDSIVRDTLDPEVPHQ